MWEDIFEIFLSLLAGPRLHAFHFWKDIVAVGWSTASARENYTLFIAGIDYTVKYRDR